MDEKVGTKLNSRVIYLYYIYINILNINDYLFPQFLLSI